MLQLPATCAGDTLAWGARKRVRNTDTWLHFPELSEAAPGQHKVSGAWGKVQEPSALHALLALLGPGGPALEEAGLFWLDPAPLEAAYGLPPGSLPPMGASPDALLRHGSLPQAPHSPAPGLHQSPQAAAASAPAGAAGLPGTGTLQGLGAGAAGFAAGAYVGAGAQAAGSAEGARVWGPGVGFGPAACEGAAGSAAGVGEGLQPHGSAGAGLRLPSGAAGLEPVEVKSTCPFQQRVRRSRKGHQTCVYAVADRGPLQHVRAAARKPSAFFAAGVSDVDFECRGAYLVACVQHLSKHHFALP